MAASAFGGGAFSGSFWKCGRTSIFFPSHPFTINLCFTNWLGARKRVTQLVCSEPFVNVRLRRQHERGTASFRIAAFGRDVPELPSAAFFASATMRHHVVAGAKQLEVI